jgi:hypothetical protein
VPLSLEFGRPFGRRCTARSSPATTKRPRLRARARYSKTLATVKGCVGLRKRLHPIPGRSSIEPIGAVSISMHLGAKRRIYREGESNDALKKGQDAHSNQPHRVDAL